MMQPTGLSPIVLFVSLNLSPKGHPYLKSLVYLPSALQLTHSSLSSLFQHGTRNLLAFLLPAMEPPLPAHWMQVSTEIPLSLWLGEQL